MFPLSCARVRSHTGRAMRAHKKRCLFHIFHTRHSQFRQVQDVAQKKSYAHTVFKKLEGTLVLPITNDVPDIHPVPGKCRVSHYSVLPEPGKIMGPSNKKKIFFFYFFLPEVLMIP